jgi:O-antigen ligase
VKKVNIIQSQNSTHLIPLGVVITSGFFWASTEDAMNLPKFTVLILFLLPVLIFQTLQSLSHYLKLVRRDSIVFVASLLFLAVMVTTLTGDSYLNSLFGAHARYNGSLMYITFILLFTRITIASNQKSVQKFLIYFYYLAIANLGYCILQFAYMDPVNWNLPFNRIVGVLGNPDFASAFLGLSAIIFSYFASRERYFNLKCAVNVSLALISSFLTFATNARQGTGIVFLAIIFLIVVLGIRRNVKLGFLITLLVSPIMLISILGMLKMGPLSPFLYKDSITYRGDYWRAAMSMFHSHPIFGVGMGRFGDFFREYRDLQQVSRRGASLVSDQAHSIPLDFLSSGGLILFLIYGIFLILISRMAILSCFRAKNKEEIALSVALSCLWFGYLAQSLISIDQIGLAIWGWVFAALVTVNFKKFYDNPNEIQNSEKLKKESSRFLPLSLAFVFLIIGTSILVPIWKSDSAIRFASAIANTSQISNTQQQEVLRSARDAIDSRPLDAYYFRQSGILLAKFGDIDTSVQALKRAIELNPREAVAHAVLGSILRQIGKPAESLQYLQRASQLDPLNQMNYYERLQSYLALNQIKGANQMLGKMKEISSNSDLYFEAERLMPSGD